MRWGRGPGADRFRTVEIPHVEGDLDGYMTASLVHRVSEWGGLDYVYSGGDVRLEMRVLDRDKDHVGYRFDRTSTGALSERIVPTEERLMIHVEVGLLDLRSGRYLFGPDVLEATVDFDHDHYTTVSGIGSFSLGQLEDLDVAEETASHALDRELSEVIVTALKRALLTVS